MNRTILFHRTCAERQHHGIGNDKQISRLLYIKIASKINFILPERRKR